MKGIANDIFSTLWSFFQSAVTVDPKELSLCLEHLFLIPISLQPKAVDSRTPGHLVKVNST